METPKQYIIKKHKLKIVMHEVAPNNIHPFLHLDTASRIMEEYAKLYHESEVKKLSKVGVISKRSDP